jgi:heat-inducible transcriptional repressor
MNDSPTLSERQTFILKCLVEEFLQSAEPVGSETLDKKYNLGVSPATIRNEMVRLTDSGYLSQPHTSSGRSPTTKGLQFYVAHIMKPKDLSVAEEVAVKERVWDYREELDKLLREATKALAEKTKTLAVTVTGDRDLYYSGAANVLEMPEFYDYELMHSLLSRLDEYDFWWDVLEAHSDPFDILLGDQFESTQLFSRCGYIYRKFQTPHVSGAIGIVGPTRLHYPTIIPLVRYMGDLIFELGRSME